MAASPAGTAVTEREPQEPAPDPVKPSAAPTVTAPAKTGAAAEPTSVSPDA